MVRDAVPENTYRPKRLGECLRVRPLPSSRSSCRVQSRLPQILVFFAQHRGPVSEGKSCEDEAEERDAGRGGGWADGGDPPPPLPCPSRLERGSSSGSGSGAFVQDPSLDGLKRP